jgi:hypothetical protein
MRIDKETDLRRNLATEQLAKVNRMFAAVTARTLGLDPNEYAKPFPPSNVTLNVLPEKSEKPVSKGLSPLAAIGIGLLGAAVPGAGIIGFLLNKAPAVVQQVEKVVEKPVEKVIELPGKSYGVDVDVEVIPPPDK